MPFAELRDSADRRRTPRTPSEDVQLRYNGWYPAAPAPDTTPPAAAPDSTGAVGAPTVDAPADAPADLPVVGKPGRK